MDDLIRRQAAIDALERKKDKNAKGDIGGFYNKIIQNDIDALIQLPSAEPQNIRCKDCIHKPKPTEDYKQGERDSGFEIEFPDYMCPLRCDDPYYSRLPKDDWFCGNAERRQDDY